VRVDRTFESVMSKDEVRVTTVNYSDHRTVVLNGAVRVHLWSLFHRNMTDGPR
jgi:hypothetical protein